MGSSASPHVQGQLAERWGLCVPDISPHQERRREGELVFWEGGEGVLQQCSWSKRQAKVRRNITKEYFLALPQKSIPIQDEHLSICLCLSMCSNPVDLNRNEAYVFK